MRPLAALRPLALAAAIALAGVPGVRVAAAQDAADEERAVAEDVLRLRNNPFLADEPDRVRKIVHGLLERRSAPADAALRDLLRDPGTHANVVEQIALLTLVVPPHRLLADVVDRLRPEVGSPLDRRLDGTLLHADREVVRLLAALARDGERPVPFRVAAIRLLGRTGDAEALDPLVELWNGPDREIRDAAADAFDAVVPGATTTAEGARAFVEALRRDDLPLTEALRRMLRERSRPQPVPAAPGTGAKAYEELALALLPRASLDEILQLYVLGSPEPSVRAAAAKRLASFPFEGSGSEVDGRVRAARALFTALRREDASEVEEAILTALATLAPSVRGGIAPDDMDAVLARVRAGDAVPRTTRLLAIRLVGALRDERAVPALESAYTAMGDGDLEARLEIVAALQEIPVDRTQWIVKRVAEERRPALLKRLVLLLGRSRDPAAAAAFAELLADSARTDVEVRREAVKALATQWASRSDAAARDALVGAGLSDPDAGVRATAAGALGIAGPGRDGVIAGLERAVCDLDPQVRRVATRSLIALDEDGALARLLDRFASDEVVFDVYREHCADAVRRDQAPDRALDAAEALDHADLRRLAIALVESAESVAPPPPRGRARLRERLADLYLAEGRPADAERMAAALLADETRDAATRDRWERTLAEALVAQGSSDRLEDAERRLLAQRSSGRLDRAAAARVALVLADCRLRRGDAIAASEALAADAADLPDDRLRRRWELVREDVSRRLAERKSEIFALVDGLAGPDAADARTRLRANGTAGDAAWFLASELAGVRDAAALGRLLAGAEAVTGTTWPRPAADATPAQIAAAAGAAREALAKVPRGAVRTSR